MADVSGGTFNPNLYAMGSGVGSNPPSGNPYVKGGPPFAPPADTFKASSETEEQKKKRRKNAQTFLMAAVSIAAAITTGIICKKVFFPPKVVAKSTPVKSFETSSIDSSSSSATLVEKQSTQSFETSSVDSSVSSTTSVVKKPAKIKKVSGKTPSKGGGKRFTLNISGKDRLIEHLLSVMKHPSTWKTDRSWMGNIAKCEDPSYFSPALKRMLSKITAKDTLFFNAHGNTKEVACFTPKQLADFLKRHGLKEVSTIKLKSCENGIKLEKNSFLESLSKELNRNGISHKAIQGYEGLYNPVYKIVFVKKPNGKYSYFRPVKASNAKRTVYN